MNQQKPLSAGASGPIDLAFDQSCNECKRRKGRCDKQLPECGPCARNKRHCLYERHSKTPLTRKHLTTVEEKLRQTELRLRQAEQRAALAEARLVRLPQETAQNLTASPMYPEFRKQGLIGPRCVEAANVDASLHTMRTHEWQNYTLKNWQPPSQADVPQASEYHLEEPPIHAEDFSWNEQAVMQSPLSPQQTSAEYVDDLGVVDGMASLSVEDTGTGYLGVASGAAMLKLMLPGADVRKQSKARASMSRTDSAGSEHHGWVPTPVYWERQISMINLDAAIDAYFACYHLAYPIVHEPTFRAQYTQTMPRPDGNSWNALAYIVAAIGIFSTATGPVSQDLDLFEAAKSNVSIATLETGNLTLVQTLTLMSNYLQKRNKPNSGYNYLGLALHMAISLGLHKQFSNWRIPPLSMEIRRRTWWTLYAFFSGATLTFGRPATWPSHGIEIGLPLNVDDSDLTHTCSKLPPPKLGMTPYSAVITQARFHLATNDIYSRVISSDFPSAAELLQLDEERIEPWRARWSEETADIPKRYQIPRMIMELRYRNFRIIMFRFHLIKHVLRERGAPPNHTIDPATQTVIDRCLFEAEASINSIHNYWSMGEHNCMASWYCLYFIFQASLIPTIMLRNNPMSPQAASWRTQLHTVLAVIESMKYINPASKECHQFIARLCGEFLDTGDVPSAGASFYPVQESPETQLLDLHGMMWPGAPGAEVETYMPDDSWMTFLNTMASENASKPPFGSHGFG